MDYMLSPKAGGLGGSNVVKSSGPKPGHKIQFPLQPGGARPSCQAQKYGRSVNSTSVVAYSQCLMYAFLSATL